MAGPELLVAAAVIQAVGTVQQGHAARQAGKAQANLINRDAAFQQEQIGFESDRLRERTARLIGAQRSGAAGAGTAANTGTNVLLQAESAEDLELELAALRYGGDENMLRSQFRARQARAQGDAAFTASLFSAGGTLISAGADPRVSGAGTGGDGGGGTVGDGGGSAGPQALNNVGFAF